MKFITAINVLLHGGLIAASPLLQARDDRGNYTVSGLGTRKQAVTSAGGTTLDLAIAMLETEDMNTDYTYGDGKSDDSANFGIFKQNWFMLRTSTSEFSGESTADYNNGAVLNSDLSEDINTRHESQNYYGYDTWFAGHRDGQSGVNDPSTSDIENYKSAVEWIQQQLETSSTYLTDDTRFWVDVTAI